MKKKFLYLAKMIGLILLLTVPIVFALNMEFPAHENLLANTGKSTGKYDELVFSIENYIEPEESPEEVFASSSDTGKSTGKYEIPPLDQKPIIASVQIVADHLFIRKCPSLSCGTDGTYDKGEWIYLTEIVCENDFLETPKGWSHASYISPNPCE